MRSAFLFFLPENLLLGLPGKDLQNERIKKPGKNPVFKKFGN